MRSPSIIAAIVVIAGCGERRPAPSWQDVAASEAVQVLKTPDNPYGVIYTPPVDLAKAPAGR